MPEDLKGNSNYLYVLDILWHNGTEFKNRLLTEYCKVNKIKFIYGLPYRPHSQGVVERLHRIIKRGLNSYKLKLKKAYNIDYAIDEIVKIKNNTYCRTLYSSNSYKIKMNSIIIILFLIFRFR